MINDRPMENKADKKKPVLMKSKHRVQKHGEVFTPRWVVEKMIAIPGIKERAEDVFAAFLEPSAGEGAFLLAIEDMKLRFVSDKYSVDLWNMYALWALSSIYGIEFLEDNLATAQQNMLDLFSKHYKAVHGAKLSKQSNLYKSARTIIRANVVQGDTLTHKNNAGEEIVFSQWKPIEEPPSQVQRIVFTYSSLFGVDDISKNGVQLSLFDEMNVNGTPENIWQECFAITDIELVWKEKKDMSVKKPGKFKFDVVIGNPPYQEEAKDTSDKPIYNLFMDEAYKIAERVSFITPARFLFNAGKTPREWNKKMLDDEHVKVLLYIQDSSEVFANTDIKGGVAVTYRDREKRFGAIGVFSQFEVLRDLVVKICPFIKEGSITDIMFLQNRFNLNILLKDYPKYANIISSKGKERRIVTSSFEKLTTFHNNRECDDDIQILGIVGSNRRKYQWIHKKYVEDNGNLNRWKVIIPKSNGSGAIGEVLSTPLIGSPLIGFTQSFISIGNFESENEANAALKYVKSKFARCLLGILKITQDNPPGKWKYVPLQDFTSASDIDWLQPIPEIDRQLYKKYDLDATEIEFIESHIKEMA